MTQLCVGDRAITPAEVLFYAVSILSDPNGNNFP